MIEYILSQIGLDRVVDESLHFGYYETFLEVALTLNLIFFAFRGPVNRFVATQAKITSWVVKVACRWATKISKRPEELESKLETSKRRLHRVASCIVFICRLCLPVVAIITLWLLAAYDSNDPIGQCEYWIILLMSAPTILGVIALYSAYLAVALWHSSVALLMSLYFFSKIKDTPPDGTEPPSGNRVIADRVRAIIQAWKPSEPDD